MIIFDLDDTLADCEHRRHHIDPSKRSDCYYHSPSNLKQMEGWYYLDDVSYPKSRVKFKPGYEKFYEECDKDEPIQSVIAIYKSLMLNYKIEIWSGRCESTREKTIDWLHKNLDLDFYSDDCCPILRMRPLGNSDPDEILKEMWLNDAKILEGKTIDFVFDDRPKVIRMWRRHGIFVFNCAQHDEEF